MALASIACGAAADTGEIPVPIDTPMAVPQADSPIEEARLDAEDLSLIRQVEELEAQLKELRWTEQDAITLVKSKINERVRECRYTDCVIPLDPLLKSFQSGRSLGGNRLGLSLINSVMKHGTWLAIYESASVRWRVEARMVWNPQDSLEPSTYAFYAYEKTGILEGVAR